LLPLLFDPDNFYNMSMENEQNIAALLHAPKQPVSLESRPIPTPGPKQVVIRNHAAALNPADWFMQESGMFIKTYPSTLGSDVAGIVHSVGSEVKNFKPGDQVSGFGRLIPTANHNVGAFQTYTLVSSSQTMHLPSSISFREGALLPMATFTSGAAIFGYLKVPRPELGSEPDHKEKGFLVWGGASSLGTAAIQILSLLGFTIYTTASPKHHDYLRSLGASHCFDYNDPDVAEKIISLSNSTAPIGLAYNIVTNEQSALATIKILNGSVAPSNEKMITHAALWPNNVEKPSDLDIQWVNLSQFDLDEFGNWFWGVWLTEALNKGTFVPSPKIRVIEGGLANLQEALDIQKKGVSGVKLVIDIL
jgi:NADPH:quinone reductase-like Zn-dependent oxidoreductase